MGRAKESGDDLDSVFWIWVDLLALGVQVLPQRLWRYTTLCGSSVCPSCGAIRPGPPFGWTEAIWAAESLLPFLFRGRNVVTMATAIHNPSVEIVSLPAPLQGALKGGETVIVSYTPANLLAHVPSLGRAFQLLDLGAGYSGATQDATYGYIPGTGGPGTAVANCTVGADATSAGTQLNLLLVQLRALNIIAS